MLYAHSTRHQREGEEPMKDLVIQEIDTKAQEGMETRGVILYEFNI